MNPKKPDISAELEAMTVIDLQEEAELVGLELCDAVLGNPIHAQNINVSGCKFNNVDIYESRLQKFRANDFIAERGDMSVVNYSNSTFIRSEFISIRLTGTNFTQTTFLDVVFSSCKLNMANFRYSKFKRVLFVDCEISEADFSGSSFELVVFENCTIEKVRFEQCTVKSLDVSESQISDTFGWLSMNNVTISPVQLIEISPLIAQEIGLQIRDI